jgi:hypothetical protein
MQIEAFDNGDTEYTFQVKMIVGASDKVGSSVSIGSLNFDIVPYCEAGKGFSFRIELVTGIERQTLFSGFVDKWRAIDWLIRKYLKGT